MVKIMGLLLVLSGISLQVAAVTQSSSKDNKLIVLISPPRSTSVMFMRMMEARGDFKVFHEATIKPRAIKHGIDFAVSERYPEAPSTFLAVKTAAFNALRDSNVFLKEMSFSILDFIQEDKAFVQDQRVQFVFLLRSPHPTAVSFFKKISAIRPVPPLPQSSYLLGYKACYSIFQEVKQHAVHKPIVIFTEELCEAPEVTVKAFCAGVGIDFKPESLQWQDLGRDFTGHAAWHEPKQDKVLIHHWHGDAIRSTGIGKVNSNYQVNAQGNPTFGEFINEADRTIIKAAYEENVPYYNLFKTEMIHHLIPSKEK